MRSLLWFHVIILLWALGQLIFAFIRAFTMEINIKLSSIVYLQTPDKRGLNKARHIIIGCMAAMTLLFLLSAGDRLISHKGFINDFQAIITTIAYVLKALIAQICVRMIKGNSFVFLNKWFRTPKGVDEF